MVVLGLIGRPDASLCHDGAACLVVDGTVVGGLEQERVSRRRYAPGEGPEAAVRTLLSAHGVHPAEVQGIGYAWQEAPAGSRSVDGPVPCGVYVSDKLTETILPTLATELGTREIFFFDHHLCHAAQAYCLNSHATADILVADGWGGDGSTSLFHVHNGKFRLLERFDRCWSLGMLYGAASAYARQGWWGGPGKLMALSSYGRRSDFRFLTFDPATGQFALNPSLHGVEPNGLSWDRLGAQWLSIFENNVFPFTSTSANTFDYAPFAADVQANIEELGLGLAARLRQLSGEETLLLSGGVALNAIMNRRIARESGYRKVAGTVAPNDGGTVFGAAMLAQNILGKPLQPLPKDHPLPIFFGPPVTTSAVEAAVAKSSVSAHRMEPDKLRKEVAVALARGEIVAWFDGSNEFGPRALGARSLLAAPTSRSVLDKINRVKGREPWRPAALSLTAEGFAALDMEPVAHGLTEYMLCTHRVGEPGMRKAVAGVHVDGTSRAQYVPRRLQGFSALLEAVGDESGLPAVINTSLNTRGNPMVLTADHAVDLMEEASDINMLVMSPYVVRRS
jgi:carbamoyltransferase